MLGSNRDEFALFMVITKAPNNLGSLEADVLLGGVFSAGEVGEINKVSELRAAGW